MKKYFFLFVFLLPCYFCFAQNEEGKDYKWGIGLQINTPERKIPNLEEESANGWDDGYLYNGTAFTGTTKDKTFSINIFANHYMKKDFFLRFNAGYSRVDIEMDEQARDASTGDYFIIENAWKKRSDFKVAPGVGYIVNIKRLGFYAGFNLPFTYYGQTTFNHFLQVNDYYTGTPVSSSEISGTIFKAYSVGIGNFAGFLFDFKRFFLGGELSYALLFSKRISESTFNILDKDLQNGTITTGNVYYNPHISNIDMSKINAAITFGYSF